MVPWKIFCSWRRTDVRPSLHLHRLEAHIPKFGFQFGICIDKLFQATSSSRCTQYRSRELTKFISVVRSTHRCLCGLSTSMDSFKDRSMKMPRRLLQNTEKKGYIEGNHMSRGDWDKNVHDA